MKLTQIKLSGFKSFVDPTTINVPGALVGVVGPNGCGKSNIIDAVRWVLGESRASALRGDSMQDVIFNGSSMRKPIGRASVELIFDNSLGRAAGQWSQYAEIAVKRVLTREGDSSYLINNTQVRRRDIHDIFLGTGLGPRAYAIIEQGMISRIIEAKPEEMRIFLEEAAGVSKYKERRKETENRLSDTRENLARVEDIRQELGGQIEKLGKQAEVAQRFNDMSAERLLKQNLLALIRKREAQADAELQTQDIAQTQLSLDQETALLRETEARLEQARDQQYAASDAVNAAQGSLYEVNAEVSRLETEIRFVAETRARIEAQLTSLGLQSEQSTRQKTELEDALGMWRTRLAAASERRAELQEMSADESAKVPLAESAFREHQATLAEARAQTVRLEQGLQTESAHVQNALSNLDRHRQRESRLAEELQALGEPDTDALQELESRLAEAGDAQLRQDESLAQLDHSRAQLLAQRNEANARLAQLERELSGVKAQLSTLQRVQDQADRNTQIDGWIGRHALGEHPRLWQRMRVEPGWEAAVESRLRDRIHALELSGAEALQALLSDPPPAKLTVFTASNEVPHNAGNRRPLLSLVRSDDAAVRAVLGDWLAGCYAVEGTPSSSDAGALAVGEWLINRDGHQFSRNGVSFHAPDVSDSGILARQREIETLQQQLETLQQQVDAAQEMQATLEQDLAAAEQALSQARATGTSLKQAQHELQMQHLRLAQDIERQHARRNQIQQELQDLRQQADAEQARQAAFEQKLVEQRQALEEARSLLQTLQASYAEAESALDTQRRHAAQVEREASEAGFAERECQTKIEEIERSVQSLGEQIEAAAQRLEELHSERDGLHDEGMREQLQAGLDLRVEREEVLSQARSHQEELASEVRAADEQRLGSEQKLQPLRDQLSDLRLKEQAARLNFEQYAMQLVEAKVDEAWLGEQLREGQRPAPLQADINRLTNAMNDLGAINMAAVEELATSTERKAFLDSQAGDLAQALETLDNAIRKIDRETRDMMQATFDTVNGHFNTLFPMLFGGGEAKLVMTGEEILDCGVQVIARPPGKKNSSIHLLSGGEKALTAISLVFSFFQLNPAPFCLLDEVDAPLDDSNTERFCELVRKMSRQTQFLYISHNKITMEMASQLIGVTMQEQGVSRVVAVDLGEALRLSEEIAA